MADTTQVLQIQEGRAAPGDFSGSPKTAAVTFSVPFVDNNLSIQITSQFDGRAWLAENITTTGFTINSQAAQPITGYVFWVAQHID
jgi:hypothetical protein